MYLEILNADMVGFANRTARCMIDYLFPLYGSITCFDFEKNFYNVLKAWDPQQPVETLLKQIRYCMYFSESGVITTGESQKLTTVYTKILITGIFNIACRRWD